MNIEEILEQLKQKGCRTTKLRKALLEVLLEKREPLSAKDLLKELKCKGFKPNLTTLYRQLETLASHEVIEPLILDSRTQLFELKKEHHHHFVCEGCEEVQDLHSEVIESAFHRFEKQLKKSGLFIQKHELTFFGECQSCH